MGDDSKRSAVLASRWNNTVSEIHDGDKSQGLGQKIKKETKRS